MSALARALRVSAILLPACTNGLQGGAPAVPADAAGEPSGPVVLVGPSGEHAFLPSDLTISAGTTVYWMWESDGHNVLSGAGGAADGLFCSPTDSGCDSAPTSNTGTRYQHTFTTSGRFPYFCAPHYGDGMKGSITVR